MQLFHSEEHRPQVEEVLTYLLTDLSVEERMRIERGQCTVESGLVCPCIEVLPISEWHCESYIVLRSLLYLSEILCIACDIDLSFCC